MRFAGIKLSNYMDSPDFGIQARQVIRSSSNERKAEGQSSFMKAMAESQGKAQYEGAQPGQDATRAAGAAAGQAGVMGGIMDGASSLIGGAIKGGKIPGLGDTPTYPGTTPEGLPLGKGSDGSYGGFGGQYGNFTPPTVTPSGNYTFG